jgi:hypothetical protein
MLEWTLSFKDGISGPARGMALSAKGLEKSLKGVRTEDERLERMLSASQGKGAYARALREHGVGVQEFANKVRAAEKSAGTGAFWGRFAKIGSAIKGASLAEVGAGIAGVAATVGAAVLRMEADLAIAAIKGGIWFAGAVADAQKFKGSTLFAFEHILGTKNAAQEIWAKTGKTATYLGADFRETMGGMNNLLARGFSADFADDIIRRMADLKQINPNANIEGLIENISRIKAQGHLQGDELEHLSEAGLNVADVYKEIAKSMKLTAKPGKDIDQQIMKLQSAGKIKSDVAIGAIMTAVTHSTGDKGAGALANERANTTMDGAIARAETLKELLLGTVNIDWSPIHRALDKITDAMQSPSGAKFLQTMGDSISAILGKLDKVSPEDMIASLDKATEAAVSLTKAINSFIDLGIEMAPILGPIIDAQITQWNGLAMAVDGTTASIRGFKNIMGMAGLGEGNGTPDVAASGSGIGTSMTDGIIAGINGGSPGITAALALACEGAMGNTKSLLGIHSPSSVFRDMFKQVGHGAALGVVDTTPHVVAANENLARGAVAGAQRAIAPTSLGPTPAGAVAPSAFDSGNVGYNAGRSIRSAVSTTSDNSRSVHVEVGGVYVDGAKDPHATGVEVANNLRSLAASNG